MKRILTLTLAAALLLMSGCASLFKKEYLSAAPYTEEEHGEYTRAAVEVSTYDELRDAINNMVRSHTDEKRLRFTNYEGTVPNDLAQARREVEEETALGSFAVDYISFDGIGKVISYYEATVQIHYKRTAEEIARINYVYGAERLPGALDEALTAMSRYTAIRMYSDTITDAQVILAANAAFDLNPLSCVFRPELAVTMHPVSGREHIIEIEFSYPKTAATILGLRRELADAIAELTANITAQESEEYALEIYKALAARVAYDPDGQLRLADKTLDNTYGGSVYGALCQGVADSQGIALAYSALCHERGIECMVVFGTLDKAEHYWNIIKLDGDYYHVDVSSDAVLGVSGAFGGSDEQFTGSFWWNIADYPACEKSLGLN